MNKLPGKKYFDILDSLKQQIRLARQKAVLTVNAQMLSLYWLIGKTILEQQSTEGWGAKIIDRLAADLKIEFPEMTGLSVRNLKYMRAFAEAWPDFNAFVQPPAAQLKKAENQNNIFVQAPPAQLQSSSAPGFMQGELAQISWYHHITILDKVKSGQERLFYIQKTVENGWSRDVMVLQIESGLYQRQGKAITNFSETLPAIDSDLARETFKNPYVFDFLTISEEAKEKDVERALIQHLRRFMLELGKGFAYVGNQYNIPVKDDDYFLDLLFYNYKLHRFVIFELKIGEFKPEFAGKLNFYINTVDAQIKGEKDDSTIGILLCKTPNKLVVQYSLQGILTPIGVSEFQLKRGLPKELKSGFPSIEELESEIDKEYEELKTPAEKRLDALKQKLSGRKKPHAITIKIEPQWFEMGYYVYIVNIKHKGRSYNYIGATGSKRCEIARSPFYRMSGHFSMRDDSQENQVKKYLMSELKIENDFDFQKELLKMDIRYYMYKIDDFDKKDHVAKREKAEKIESWIIKEFREKKLHVFNKKISRGPDANTGKLAQPIYNDIIEKITV